LKHPYINDKTIKEVSEILRSGDLSLFRGTPDGQGGGYWVQKLEEIIKDTFGVKYAVAMNSATACLHTSLLALGIGKDDKVVVSPYSFVSSASCVLMVGATPVFCDIEDETFCIDVDKLEPSDYKAIIPVDLCGHPADYDKIRKLNIPIIEDSAQAIGGKYKDKYCGTLGDCGIFSFNQSKQVSCGEGGALLTDNEDIYRKARAIRNHGEVSNPDLKMVGYNYRLNEIEACIVYNQILDLDFNIERRRELCHYMTRQLRDIEIIEPPIEKEYHSYYTYFMKYKGKDRDDFQKEMLNKGIYFGSGYVTPLYRYPIFQSEIRLPVVERMWSSEAMVTDLFRYPMTIKDCEQVVEKVKDALSVRMPSM